MNNAKTELVKRLEKVETALSWFPQKLQITFNINH